MRNRFILTKEKNTQLTKQLMFSRLFSTTWLMLILLSLSMWQCKPDEFKSETTGICPEVISTDPADKAINVVSSKKITATFNEKMNSATIDQTTFLLKQGTTAVSGTVTPASGQFETSTFTPASPLAPFSDYTGTIKKGVKDPMNNALQGDKIWSFTTQPYLTLTSNPLVGGTTSIDGIPSVGKALNVDASVTVKAIPGVGYVFANWTEGGTVLSPDASYTFPMNTATIKGNRTLAANFTAQYTVTLSSLPLAGGTTTGGGSYNSGASVTVSAIPSVGYTFTNWTEAGTAVSALKDYTFLLSANRVLVANFAINMYSLNITATNGTVAKVPNQTTFSHGTSVQLTATPNAGYTFTSWSGDATGTASPVTVIMNSDKNITANFTAVVVQFNVALSSNPLLGGTTSGGGSFNSGASVTVRAVPAVGYTFKNWTEGLTSVSSNANYTFTISGNKTFVANFTPVVVGQFTVALSSNPLLGGTTTGAGSYNSGASVTVNAVPAVGYTFKNWTEGATIVSSNANYTFTISGNKTFVANFTPVVAGQFLVSLSSNPALGGTTNGGGSFNSGASVTVSAVPAVGYTFTNWTEGIVIASTNANYTFTITADRTLVANFTANQAASGPPLIDLGCAAPFAILAGSTITSTGPSIVTGDVGLSPGSALIGFPPGTIIGTKQITTPIAAAAKLCLTAAFNDGQGRSLNAISLPGQLGGLTLAPGLYSNSSSSGISGTGANGILTLDAGGNANAVWIFQMGSTLKTDPATSIVLAGGALAKNIFWIVGTSATLGTTSVFYGNILADQAITLNTGAVLNGRALTRIAAVTIDDSRVTKP
jgi:uncharacterized repeat protein (TIGR02543 family)